MTPHLPDHVTHANHRRSLRLKEVKEQKNEDFFYIPPTAWLEASAQDLLQPTFVRYQESRKKVRGRPGVEPARNDACNLGRSLEEHPALERMLAARRGRRDLGRILE